MGGGKFDKKRKPCGIRRGGGPRSPGRESLAKGNWGLGYGRDARGKKTTKRWEGGEKGKLRKLGL